MSLSLESVPISSSTISQVHRIVLFSFTLAWKEAGRGWGIMICAEDGEMWMWRRVTYLFIPKRETSTYNFLLRWKGSVTQAARLIRYAGNTDSTDYDPVWSIGIEHQPRSHEVCIEDKDNGAVISTGMNSSLAESLSIHFTLKIRIMVLLHLIG